MVRNNRDETAFKLCPICFKGLKKLCLTCEKNICEHLTLTLKIRVEKGKNAKISSHILSINNGQTENLSLIDNHFNWTSLVRVGPLVTVNQSSRCCRSVAGLTCNGVGAVATHLVETPGAPESPNGRTMHRNIR